MKKNYLILLFLSSLFSLKSYAQNQVPLDEDALRWGLAHDFMGTNGDLASRQGTCTGVDNEDPQIGCVLGVFTEVVQSTSTLDCGAVVFFLGGASATDNCPGVSVTYSPPSGSVFPVGSHDVVCTATDASGNTASCTIDVLVLENILPVITCPADITVNISPNTCSAAVTWAAPLATDNCSIDNVVCNPPSGSIFPIGTTTVVCTAADPSNNTASCTFDVTVVDNTGNCIGDCPQNITLNNTGLNDLYHAVNIVSVENALTIGTNVSFKAGNLIELKNNFSALPSTDFSAEIEECISNFGSDGDQN